MKNQDVRNWAGEAGVKLWEIADKLNMNDGNFSRKMRHELPEEKKEQIREIIRDIKEEKAYGENAHH